MSILRYMRMFVFVASSISPGVLAAENSPSDSSTDVVIFKNGDTLTGSIRGTTSSTVEFANPSVGSLTLEWSDLQTLRFHHKITVITGAADSRTSREFKDASVSPTTTAKKLNLEVKENGEANAVMVRDVQSISGPNGAAFANSGWRISAFKINTAILEATQKQQTYGGELRLLGNWHPEENGWRHQRTLVDVITSYDEKRKNNLPGAATITRDYDGKLQHLFFMTSDNVYGSTVAELYHNNSLGIYLEQSYGAGVGWIVHDIELNADLRFIGEHFFGPNPSASLIGSELSARRTFTLMKGAKLTPTVIVIPVFNSRRAWQTRGLLDLAIPITPKLQFNVMASDYYVENAPSPFRKNYFKTTIGLQYSPTTGK